MDILKNTTVGRYAVAKRKFCPGEEIFSEAPFAFGPKSDSPPICLGCYKPTPVSLCSKCYWPVCNEECEINPAHRLAECKIFSKSRVRFQRVSSFKEPCLQYECITPLRVLLAKESLPDRWNLEVKYMEAHNSLRETCAIWNFNAINVVGYLRGPCGLGKTFSEELIHTVCGILEVNAFEARSLSGYPIRCLFSRFAILSHNCISNITHTIVSNGKGDEGDFSLTVRAAIEIKEEEELFSSYTYSVLPTIIRRQILKESKYFDCCCPRCSDPSEMGTYLSSIRCKKCTGGFLSPSLPLDYDTNWICFQCRDFLPNDNVRKLFKQIQIEIDLADGENQEKHTNCLEELIEKYSRALHPLNAYNCNLYLTLIGIYGNGKHLSSPILQEKKVKYCKMILKVLDVIEPGVSRIRGTILYELYLGLLLMEHKNEEISSLILKEALNILKQCISILKLEPPTTTEGKLGIIASKSLTLLQQHYEDIAQGNVKPLTILNTAYV